MTDEQSWKGVGAGRANFLPTACRDERRLRAGGCERGPARTTLAQSAPRDELPFVNRVRG